jgi:hypothetical protein
MIIGSIIRRLKGNAMQNKHEIQEEINKLTNELATSFPERYKLLGETPLSAGVDPMKEPSLTELESYRNTLWRQLEEARMQKPAQGGSRFVA